MSEPRISRMIEDDVVAGVLTEAVWRERRRPGLWQDMVSALRRGAEKTKEGTANAFLFHAMVDRLLEEYHSEEG